MKKTILPENSDGNEFISNTALAVISLILISMMIAINASAQVENVIVEKYYVSDANDATDTTGGRSIEAGSYTYRVFVDLAPGSKLKRIYGDINHPLIISSTDTFYNNTDRPDKNFGYLLNKSWLDDNPAIALDSWLTIGLALTAYTGVPKADDTDGSFIGGTLNNGGTAAIPGGILINNDPTAGDPLTIKDGYIPNAQTYGQWIDLGFEDAAGEDTTVFGPLNQGGNFYSTVASLQQNSGVSGPDADNVVLVAQLTTAGELYFELNLEVEVFDGVNYNLVKYVANDSILLQGEVISPFLTYPQACGCTDPAYIEYSPSYACNVQDSCKNLVVFGCMDTIACNYDASSNYHVQTLCCYPGYCNDRDLELVCPGLNNGRISITSMHPNPANEMLSLAIMPIPDFDLQIRILDLSGRIIFNENTGKHDSPLQFSTNVSSFAPGMYILQVMSGDQMESRKIHIE